MSQGTLSDTLIRLETFNSIFLFRPKIDIFPRAMSRGFGQKWPNFEVSIYYVPKDLGVS